MNVSETRILIVDDDPSIRELLPRILQDRGYRCDACADAEEALQRIESGDFSVVVTDIELPAMSGIGLLRSIKSTGEDVLVIITTGSADVDTAVQTLRLGADGYLTKPINFDELFVTIERALRNRQLTVENKQYQERVERWNEELQREIERRTEELESMQSHLLRSAQMASVGQLVTGIAHEINNPIGFISSNLTSLGHYISHLKELLDKYDEIIVALQQTELGDQTRELLETLSMLKETIHADFILTDIEKLMEESRQGAERVKGIVDNLLNFSSSPETEAEPADVNRCIQYALSLVQRELRDEIEVVEHYGDVPRLRCFPLQLSQGFVSLLLNAIQAIEETGTVSVRTYLQADQVCIKISDTGAGISPENLSHIFDPFFSTRDVGAGSGLGLTVVYGVIQQHGGKIDVESKVGEGTTFTIMLPREGIEDG